MTSFKRPLRILLTACLAAGTPILAQPAEVMPLSEDHPGMLASWMQSRPIYSSNGAVIPDIPPDRRPADWTTVARIHDLLISDTGQLLGVVVESGGLLGVGGHQVVLSPDSLTPMRIGAESFFVTPMTEVEVQALPDFDTTFVLR